MPRSSPSIRAEYSDDEPSSPKSLITQGTPTATPAPTPAGTPVNTATLKAPEFPKAPSIPKGKAPQRKRKETVVLESKSSKKSRTGTGLDKPEIIVTGKGKDPFVPVDRHRKRQRSRDNSRRRDRKNSNAASSRAPSGGVDFRSRSYSGTSALALELSSALKNRPEFEKYSEDEVHRSARLFVKFGLNSLEEIKFSRQKHRDYFEDDMRQSGYHFGDLKLIIEIFDLFPPPRRNIGNNAKPLFEEVNIPLVLKQFTIDCSGLSDPIRPDQTMVNVISQELALASNSTPVFTPYIFIDYSKKPWLPSIVEHENALLTFRNKMKSYKSIQPLSTQQYTLYRLRFVMSAALCNAFDLFGGTIAQINNIAIIMQISIVENPNIALLYDAELQNRLSKYARERTPDIDYFQLLSTLQIDILRTIQQRVAQSASAANRPPPKGKADKGDKGAKGDKGEKAKRKGKKGGEPKPFDALTTE